MSRSYPPFGAPRLWIRTRVDKC
ncbi:hypothetical protein VTJ04DRAFT_4428 [Mycothermus thermophilus]